jgi:hypothetical protein
LVKSGKKNHGPEEKKGLETEARGAQEKLTVKK